jgi:two-component system, chemotaxis family, sensor kinase CheA
MPTRKSKSPKKNETAKPVAVQDEVLSAVPSQKRKSPVKNDLAKPTPTLDDVVSLLIQLEPGKIEGFKQLSDEIHSMCAENFLNEKIKSYVMAAKEQIDCFIQGDITDAEDVIIETSRLLEHASNEKEKAVFEDLGQPMEDLTSVSGNMEETGIAQNIVESEPAKPVDAGERLGSKDNDATQQDIPAGQKENMVNEVQDRLESIPVQTDLPADADHDLISEFIMESRELLESSETALLELENNPEDFEAVNTVFRAFHTVKGTSGFLGLEIVSKLAHLAESLLSRIRNKEISLIGGYADLSLRSLDMLKKVVASVEGALRGLQLEIPEGYELLMVVLADPEAAGISEEVPDALAESDEAQESDPDSANNETDVIWEPTSEENAIAAEILEETKLSRQKKTQAKRDGAEFESSIRVNTARLDRLIDMVGELVIAQSMVAQDRRLIEENSHDLLRKVTHAGKIVRELQDLSMSMRMVPLRGTFQKMQRVARDLSRKSGKSIELVADDGETEIDRHMVDILNDVLVHMVRNSIDHGIEPQDDREREGKNRTGTVRLKAFHSGGSVVVEIQDDGRGLNREKILQKAVATGIVEPDKQLSDNEVFNLIFAPGLSTSEKITDVSGRGVGMDVVRKGIESLHGRIDINTAPGVGSTFTVRLPLTLAITDGMLVRVGSERYIIPTISIHLCFRPKPDALSTVSGRGELVMLRGDMMPIFRLHKLFDIDSAIENPAQGLLVVVGDENRRCALLVDELLGQQQVVAKSLTRAVGKVPGVSGGAILGDGQVGLILDPNEVALQARQTRGIYGVSAQKGRTAA